jgi:hypothetical protein
MPFQPWSEKIIDSVLAGLRKISTANGYYTDPGIVQRYSRTLNTFKDTPIISLYKLGELRNLRGSDYWNAEINLGIDGIIDPEAEDWDTTTDVLVTQLEDDIMLALNKEVDWATLRAELTRFDSANALTDEPEDPNDGTTIKVTIQYAHQLQDTRAPLAPL